MQTRTSKKQMHEAEKALCSVYPNDAVYAAGEWDATGKAYIMHNGECFTFPSNTDAYYAVAELILMAEF